MVEDVEMLCTFSETLRVYDNPFPRYVIATTSTALVKIHISAWADHPMTVYFLVSAQENARMARILSGQDNDTSTQMAQLIELLKFHPGFMLAPQLLDARKHFIKNAKHEDE